MLIDTHTHLYWDSYQEDLDQVIQRSLDAEVTTIINVGVDIDLSKKAAEQVKKKLSKIPNFKAYFTIGIHPHEAIRYPDDVSIHKDMKQLEGIYQENRSNCIAVGECGLDYFFDNNPGFVPPSISPKKQKQVQQKLFQAQIDLAKKLNLPLIVHCRDDRSQNPQNNEAWDEVLKMVKNHPTILHCYSGLPTITNQILKTNNLIISFAATLTYPKNEYLREAARVIPLEKIVLETDCPFLPPQSKRGQRNEPANIKETAQLIADLKGISLEEVARQTTKNVKILFNI